MTKKLVLALAAIATACPAAHADYNCTATLIETVPVMTVDYKTPAGVDLDLSKGVPSQYVTQQTDLNPQLFDGDYSKLEYHSSAQGDPQSGMEGSVTYTLDINTPTPIKVIETCDADVLARSGTCMYDFVNGSETSPVAMIQADSKDSSLKMPMITGVVMATVKDNAMTVALIAHKVTFDMPSGSAEIAEGQSDVILPLGLEKIDASVMGSNGSDDHEVMLKLSCITSAVPQR
jgi:hypothetical protein